MAANAILNADLHCHSVVSDGTLTPEVLAGRAKANGVELWSLTDQDEIGGQNRAAAAAKAQGMRYLTGTEISVTFAGETVHIVGLGFDPDDAHMVQGLRNTRGGRTERAREMSDGLAKAARWLRQQRTCSSSYLPAKKLLRAKGLKSAQAMAALVSGMLVKAFKVGGMAQPQFAAIARFFGLWPRLLDPEPAKADVEALVAAGDWVSLQSRACPAASRHAATLLLGMRGSACRGCCGGGGGRRVSRASWQAAAVQGGAAQRRLAALSCLLGAGTS